MRKRHADAFPACFSADSGDVWPTIVVEQRPDLVDIRIVRYARGLRYHESWREFIPSSRGIRYLDVKT